MSVHPRHVEWAWSCCSSRAISYRRQLRRQRPCKRSKKGCSRATRETAIPPWPRLKLLEKERFGRLQTLPESPAAPHDHSRLLQKPQTPFSPVCICTFDCPLLESHWGLDLRRSCHSPRLCRFFCLSSLIPVRALVLLLISLFLFCSSGDVWREA